MPEEPGEEGPEELNIHERAVVPPARGFSLSMALLLAGGGWLWAAFQNDAIGRDAFSDLPETVVSTLLWTTMALPFVAGLLGVFSARWHWIFLPLGFIVGLGMTTPGFIRARSQGQLTACKSNVKNIATVLEMYAYDNDQAYPESLSLLTPNYMKVVPSCPAAGEDTYSRSYVHFRGAPRGGPSGAPQPADAAYTVVCSGHHHKKANVGPNLPQYTSREGLIDR